MENIPYYEILVDDVYQGRISISVLSQLMLKDDKLRVWYQFHRELEKSLKKNRGSYCNNGKPSA
jgi:hypothetical protein